MIDGYQTIETIKEANEKLGHHFFDEDTLRFFGSKIYGEVYPGGYFVTSEKDRMGRAWDGERRYTVRRADVDGSVDTVGEFGEYDSLRAARRAAEWQAVLP